MADNMAAQLIRAHPAAPKITQDPSNIAESALAICLSAETREL